MSPLPPFGLPGVGTGPRKNAPHFDFPFRLGADGHAAELEQDTEDEIGAAVELIVSVPLGSLEDQPDLGISDPTFTTVPNLLQIAAEVNQWEPRAKIDLSALSNQTDVSVETILLAVQRNTNG